MASQLHEAVRLAQEGRRDDARRLLRQVVQTDPNNEMAWLWLASVAADQTEYERALNEVLRINPTNQQARTLRDQFIQQYGSRLNVAPAQTPPPVAPYTPPQTPPYSPPQTPPPYDTPTGQPSYGQPQSAPPQPPPASYYGTPAAYGAPPAQDSAVRYERVVERRRRRGCFGCGCIPSCLIVFALVIILPIVACGAIAYSNRGANLGPGDWLLVYLPGDLGRKDVEFEIDNRAVSVSVPRSWYLAQQDDQWWTTVSDVLDQSMPFEDTTTTWANEAVDLAAATLQNANVPILETSPIQLAEAGAPSGLLFQGLVQAGDAGVSSFACDAVPGAEADIMQDVPAGTTFTVVPRGQWCGYRLDSVMTLPDQAILQRVGAPAAMHVTEFYIPLANDSASAWSVSVPESQYAAYSDDIDHMIETASVAPGGSVG